MPKDQYPQNPTLENNLLAALPEAEYLQLLPDLEVFNLNFGEIIYQQDDIIREVYFLESGIISIISSVGERAKLEISIVGNEGMVGLPIFLGVSKIRNQVAVQGAGIALKMKAVNFLQICRKNSSLVVLLQRYTHFLITQISQVAVCNRFHQTDTRLARWLLIIHDRMKVDEFSLTQEFLSDMLGVRREAVSKAANNFQKKQLIEYSRGNLKVLNRVGLEMTACKCYQIIKEEEENIRLLPANIFDNQL